MLVGYRAFPAWVICQRAAVFSSANKRQPPLRIQKSDLL